MIICTVNTRRSFSDRLAGVRGRLYTCTNMPRRKKMRYCRGVEGYNLYKPAGIPMSQLDVIELGLDELEAMRLCDFDGQQQEDAAEAMGVSRGTIQRLLQSGRHKVLDALVGGKSLAFADADHVCIGPSGPRGPACRGRRFGSGPNPRGGPAPSA